LNAPTMKIHAPAMNIDEIHRSVVAASIATIRMV
jgi:hypothetical protein